MKIQQYVASLLPSFKREQISEDIRITRQEIRDNTIPSYENASAVFKGWKFKSEQLKPQIDQFNRMVKVGTGSNIILTIGAAMKPLLENLEIVDDLIGKSYNEDVAGGGMTFQKANLLQFVECAAFVSKYARKFLVWTYTVESAAYDENAHEYVKNAMVPAEIDWIKANFLSFCQALNIVSGRPADVRRTIAAIPDIVITGDNTSTVAATMGESKIDPFMMKLIPIWLNPIYHIGMFVAEWQASRYKSAQEESKLLQMRKINLEKLAAGKPDAKLEQEIQYTESRIQALNYKIDKMEKANA
jgi:hypothetical protein